LYRTEGVVKIITSLNGNKNLINACQVSATILYIA
jgi:hypothetical protein